MIHRNGDFLFSKISLADLQDRKLREIFEAVERLQASELESLSAEIFVDRILKENAVTLLEIDFGQPTRDPAQEAVIRMTEYGEAVFLPAVRIAINFKFSGSPWLLNAFGNMRTTSPPKGTFEVGRLSLIYTAPQDMSEDRVRNEMLDMLKRDEDQVKIWVRSVNAAATQYNQQITETAGRAFELRAGKIARGKQLAESLGIPLERRPSDEVQVLHPTPIDLKVASADLSNSTVNKEWHLASADYSYILELVEQMVLVMERSPKTFARMQEEELRDIILVILNAHFKGEATGETFNFKGKTDILIRHQGQNVFIAECKFWKGPKSFQDAIDQILGYTTWRDTKAALIVFNRGGKLTNTIKQILASINSHPAYKSTSDSKSETHFQFILGHPADRERSIFLAILVFEVPSLGAPAVSD